MKRQTYSEEYMKRCIVAFALVLTLTIPGLAQAYGDGSISGIYIAPKFLMSIQDTGKVDRSSGVSGFDVSDYSEFGVGGALAAGYDLWAQHSIPVRTEIEMALRTNSSKEWKSINGKIKGTWNNSSLMANVFYDFHNDTQFTPYVGAGLGLAFNYAGYDVREVNGNSFSMSEHSTSFAWNVGLGAAYNFNDNFAVDAQYRFVGMGHAEPSANVVGKHYEVGTRPYNNEFALGLRFGF